MNPEKTIRGRKISKFLFFALLTLFAAIFTIFCLTIEVKILIIPFGFLMNLSLNRARDIYIKDIVRPFLISNAENNCCEALAQMAMT
jgi:hypothetical protein